VKLHGSDINVIAKLPGPRRLTAWALSRTERVVAVSRALAEEVVTLGVPRDRVAIVMNGVDGELFRPRDRAAARAELGLPAGPLALYVGNLKADKGVLDLAAAWSRVARELPEAQLAIVGGGPARGALEAQLPPGARLHGPQPLAQVPTWMAACDILVLPSHAEGTPNVVLEALACGRRVVASSVGGIPDLITCPTLGQLVPAHQPEALAAALTDALRTPYAAEPVAELGARGGWEPSAAALHAVLVAAAGASVGVSR
jgi:glycosyltransferase involved in cell wall biosynthesis